MATVKSVIDSLKREKPPLKERIQSGIAKMEGLESIQVQRELSRNSERMHRQSVAMWNGLHKQNPWSASIGEFQMADGSDEGGDMRDQIVLGDQIIVGDKAIKSMPSNEGEADDEEEEPKPNPPDPSEPSNPPETPKPNGWSKAWPALALASGLAGGYMLADWNSKPDEQQSPPAVADRFGGTVMTYEP